MATLDGPSSFDAALHEHDIDGLRRQLLAAVRRSCPAWLTAHAEDIVQTALVQILQTSRRSGGTLRLIPSYIKKAAYNATVDEIRRQFRRKELPEEEAGVSEIAAEVPIKTESRIEALEIDRGIRDCLCRLSKPRRIAVVCHLQGYSAPETARFVGWTAKKVEHLLRRGLVELRDCLSFKGLKP